MERNSNVIVDDEEQLEGKYPVKVLRLSKDWINKHLSHSHHSKPRSRFYLMIHIQTLHCILASPEPSIKIKPWLIEKVAM